MNLKKKTFFIYFCLALSFVTVPASSLFCQAETDDALLKKGIYLFRQENYDEALEVFGRVVGEKPDSSIAAYYLGLTHKRTEDYVSAEKYLELSLTMTPKIKGALIELIDLLYRLGKFDEAKKWIKVAEEEGIRPAEARFLKGLTLQKSGSYEEAVKAFEEAEDLDARLKQAADYQIGMCYLGMKRFSDARDIFKETFDLDPYSGIGSLASRYVEALERKEKRDRPFHLSAAFAFEYDSNVILKPTDTALFSTVTDKDDTRQVFDVKGDYTVGTEDKRLSLKTGYGLKVSKQNTFGKYDVIGNNLSAQGNVVLDKLMATFPMNYNYTVVDDKKYLSSIIAGNVNNFMTVKGQMAQAGVLYNYDEYLAKPDGSGENRAGNEITALAGYFWFFAGNEGFLNLKYSINKDWAKGKNWEYWGNKISAVVLYPLWNKFRLSVSGEVFVQDFSNKHSVYDKKRMDEVYTAGSFLSYEIFPNTEIQARYTYVKEQSNLSIYKYDRYVISTGVQYQF